MNYSLDQNAAADADKLYSRIDSKGAYLGTIVTAEAVKSKKGSIGIDISFKADSGETANYLTLWTHNAQNEQLHGFKVLMAIMTCLRLRNISKQSQMIEKYDFDTRQKERVAADVYLDLMDKPIGLLISMEEYQKNDGGYAWKPVIKAAFDKNQFTASEVLSKAKAPEQLEKMLQALKDKPLQKGGSAPSSQGHAGTTVADLNDDCPF